MQKKAMPLLMVVCCSWIGVNTCLAEQNSGDIYNKVYGNVKLNPQNYLDVITALSDSKKHKEVIKWSDKAIRDQRINSDSNPCFIFTGLIHISKLAISRTQL